MRRRSGLKKKARSTVSKKREKKDGTEAGERKKAVMNNNDDTNFNINSPSESRLSRSLHLKVIANARSPTLRLSRKRTVYQRTRPGYAR